MFLIIFSWDIFWGFFLKWIFGVNDISCDFFDTFFNWVIYWIFNEISYCIWEISLTNIFSSEFLLTEFFNSFLLIPFFSMFIFCLYLSGVFFWGDFLVVFFRWIFWVIILWVFLKRVLCYEEIIILSLNIFFKWFIRGFIIFLCIIHYFYFLWEKEDFCGINFSEVIILEIILMDVSLLFRSIVENFLRRVFLIISFSQLFHIYLHAE